MNWKKKLLALGLSLTLTLSLTACGQKAAEPEQPEEPAQTEEPATETPDGTEADIAHFKAADIADNQRLFRANPAAHIVQDNPSKRHGAPAAKADRPPRIQKNIRKHDVVKQPCLHSFIHGNFNGKPAYRDGDSREGKVADFMRRLAERRCKLVLPVAQRIIEKKSVPPFENQI